MTHSMRAMRSQSFLGHAAVYGIGNMLTQAAGFLLLPIYTHYLLPSDYGMWEVLNRFSEVLIICLLGRGLRQASLTFFRQACDEEERRRVSSTIILTFGASGLLGVAAVTLVSAPLTGLVGIGSPALLRLAMAAMFFGTLATIPLALIQARMESRLYVLVNVLQFLVRVCLTILLVVGLGWGLWGVLTASAVTSGIFAAALCGRELRRGWHFDIMMLPSIFGFTLPFIPGGLSIFLMNWGDRFFLLRYGGADAVGVYALGYKLATVVGMFTVTPLYMVWGARMYDVAEGPDASKIFGLMFSRILGAYVAVGLALALVQDEVIQFLGGRQFANAASVVAPVLLAYAFLSAADLMDSGFYVRRRTSLKVWISGSAAVTMLGLYALLIRPLGTLGAALATLVGFATQAVLTHVLSQRVFPVRYEWGRLVGMMSLAVVLWLAGQLIPAGGPAIVAKIMLWTAWPAVLWATRLVSSEEKDWVRSIVRQALDRLGITPRRHTADNIEALSPEPGSAVRSR